MNGKELWMMFAKEHKLENVEYDEWMFGDSPNLLCELVLKGIKTATSSAYDLYELDNEALPKEGGYSVILNSNQEAQCIIYTTKVTIVLFKEVTKEHAYKEGEGDRTLTYWRKVHKEFYTKCLNEVNLSFDDNMKVVCEEFKVVYKRK